MKPLERVAVPDGVVTDTDAGPTAPAGVTAVTDVGLTTVTFVAGFPPTMTDVAPERFVPVSVIVVPPAFEPEVGATDESVGSSAVYVNRPPAPTPN